MSHTAQLFEKNKKYVPTHQAIPFFDEFPPGSKTPDIIIYACVDARVDPIAILGLEPGEALVIRNAGGNIQRNIDDLLFLDQLLGLKEVILIKHTDCGATHLTEEAVKDGLKRIAPENAIEIDGKSFGTFKDVAGSAVESVRYVKANPLVRKELRDNTIGAVYDLKTGTLTTVEA